MTEKSAPPCENCGRPRGPGSGLGLCARCYQYQRRHGALPPKKLMVTGDLTAQMNVRMSADLEAGVRAAAEAAGVDPAEWVRGALEKALKRRK